MPFVDAHVVEVKRKAEGSEWFRMILDDPHIKVLESKHPAAINEAMSLMTSGAFARIKYIERESGNINPHTNQPYPPSRWWEEATQLGDAPPPAPARPQEAQQAAAAAVEIQRQTHPVDAWRMSLNKGAELAVATLPMMPVQQRDFETQKRIAVAWATVINQTPIPSGAAVADNPTSAFQAPANPGTATSPGAYADPAGGSPPPHDDNDVPF